MNIEKFGCPHCGNDNINEFVFNSVDFMNPQNKQNPILNGYSYEWKPKIPIGFHFKCSKCGKDTFIIPENGKYGTIEWGEDIPQQVIFTPVYKQPEFSATTFIMYNEERKGGYLDQVVTTNQNTILSLITREVITEDGSWKIIDKKMYNLLKSKGFKEVGIYESNDDDATKSIRTTSSTDDATMAANDTTAATGNDAKGTTNDARTEKQHFTAKGNRP